MLVFTKVRTVPWSEVDEVSISFDTRECGCLCVECKKNIPQCACTIIVRISNSRYSRAILNWCQRHFSAYFRSTCNISCRSYRSNPCKVCIVGHRRAHAFEVGRRNKVAWCKPVGIKFWVTRAEESSNTCKVFLSVVQVGIGISLLRCVVNEGTIEEYAVSLERNSTRCNLDIINCPSWSPCTIVIGVESNPYTTKTSSTWELSKVNLKILPCTRCSNHWTDYCPCSTSICAELNISALTERTIKITCEVQTIWWKICPIHFRSNQIIAASVAILKVVIANCIFCMRRNSKWRTSTIGCCIPTGCALGKRLPSCRWEYWTFEVLNNCNCKRLIPCCYKGKIIYIQVTWFVFFLWENNVESTVWSNVRCNHVIIKTNFFGFKYIIVFPDIFKYYGTIFRNSLSVNCVRIILTSKANNSTSRAATGSKTYINSYINQFFMPYDVWVNFCRFTTIGIVGCNSISVPSFR